MNDILNELITDIVLLGEAVKKPAKKSTKKPAPEKEKKPSTAKVSKGGKWYTADPKAGGEYVGRYDGTKWINATPEEKAKEKQKAGTQGYGKDFVGKQGRGIMPQQPSPQIQKPSTKSARVKKVFGGENPDSPVPDATLEKAVKLLQRVAQNTQAVKPDILTNLLDAINNGDAKRIQREVGTLGLVISSTGRLVSTLHGDIFGRGETGKNALKTLSALLSRFGIELERKKSKTEVKPKPKVDKDNFKPTELVDNDEFPEIRATTITYPDSTDPRGFSVDGDEHRVIRRDKQRLVETTPVNEIFLSQGMSQDEAEQKAEEADQKIAAHNKQVKFLASSIQNGNKFRRLPAGQKGRTALKDRLLDLMLSNSDLDDAQKKIVSDMLTRLSQADTTEEFDSAWEEFRNQIENDSTLRPAIPYICENVEMLRKAVDGGTVLIPMSSSFKVADVVILSKPLPSSIDVDDIDSIAANIQLVDVTVDFRSVKSLKGGAGVLGYRVALTVFDIEERETHLDQLVSSTSHAELWACKTKEELDAYSKKQLEVLSEYLPDIIAYYKLPENTTFDEAVAILSGGLPPRYDRNGNYIGAGKPSGTFDQEMTDLNRLQLRLYSFIGYASDAIYNRGAQRQGFTNTTFYDDGIVETDGSSVLGRSVFQFNKQLNRRADGIIRDDGFASRIVATPKDEMRTFK